MPEIVAIWLAGIVLALLALGVAAAVLRFTAGGLSQEMRIGDVFKVLVVVVVLCCAVLSLLVLVS